MLGKVHGTFSVITLRLHSYDAIRRAMRFLKVGSTFNNAHLRIDIIYFLCLEKNMIIFIIAGSVGLAYDLAQASVCRSGKHFTHKIGRNGTVALTSKLKDNLNCYFWATESGNIPVVKRSYRRFTHIG